MYALVFALILCASAFGVTRTAVIAPATNISIHEDYPTAPLGSSFRFPDNPLDDVFQAGTTWFDRQHLGTSGRMVGVDELGFAHVVWTRGWGNPPNVERHVYYNVFDPTANTFLFEAGVPADNATRSGYVCLALDPSGFCFPTCQYVYLDTMRSGIGIDFLPENGSFTYFSPIQGTWEEEIIWPKSARDRQRRLHMVATSNATPMRIFYARGVPIFDEGFGLEIQFETWPDGNQWLLMDTVTTLSANVVCSRTSDRVAIIYSRSREYSSSINNDLYVIYSEDGGDIWGEPVNVTQFEFPDFDCPGGDTLVCDRDTFRVFTDNSALFDMNDVLHVAFTTGYFYELEGVYNIAYSDIWHWDEQYQYFSNIAHGSFQITDSILWRDPGFGNRIIQRPSLAIDTVTWGEMYCSFQRFDTLQTSETGWPQGEIYVAASPIIFDSDWITGVHWMEAVNVSNTNGGVAAPQGQSLSEGDITAAEFVVRENFVPKLYLSYIMDTDAGISGSTECSFNIMRIPASDANSWQPHNVGYPALRIDSTGYPPPYLGIHAGNRNELSRDFTLHANYPNPFNPATAIQFDLARDASVTLKVFDVQGRLVETLLDHQSLSAGVHMQRFDAAGLSSGVYFYRLETPARHETRKMVLLK